VFYDFDEIINVKVMLECFRGDRNMRPKTICPIFAHNDASYFEDLKKIDESGCDIIEIRLDALIEEDPTNWLEVFKKSYDCVQTKILATIRTSKEGGKATLDGRTYSQYIRSIFTFENIYVDVELPYVTCIDNFEMYCNRVFLSKHYFDHTPKDLKKIWESMDPYAPFVKKIACMPETVDDVARLLISCYEHKTDSKKLAISMSKLGSVSRVAGFVFESEFTFTTLTESSAPGQIPLEKMNEILDLLVE
jgi:3-dehydroquinate dehydratase type I